MEGRMFVSCVGNMLQWPFVVCFFLPYKNVELCVQWQNKYIKLYCPVNDKIIHMLSMYDYTTFIFHEAQSKLYLGDIHIDLRRDMINIFIGMVHVYCVQG